jgi:hypothetical protein
MKLFKSQITLFFNVIVSLLCIAIPLIWSKQINGNYYNAKMFVLFLTSGFALLSFSTADQLKKIQFHKSIYVLILFFLYYQFAFNLQNSYLSILFGLKPLALYVLSYFFFQFDTQFIKIHRQTFFILTGLLLTVFLSLHIYEIYEFRVLKDTIDQGRMLGTFGNINMVSEFFILSLPFLYWYLTQPRSSGKDQPNDHFKFLALTFWVFIILYSRSRSSWIGLVLFAVFIAYKHFNKKHLAYMALGWALYLACMLIPTSQKDLVTETKAESFIERLSLYKATAQLIADRPFGTGLGTFTNEIIPYRLVQEHKPHEFQYADQPHSEILKWGAQYGWIGLVFCLGLFGYVVFSLYNLKNTLLISGFLVLLPQILFQFPFENPASILLIAMYLGFWLKKIMPEQQFLNSWKTRSAFIVLGLVMVLNSFAYIYSIYIESQFNKDLEKTSLMCSIYPINHKNCNYKNVLLLEANQTSKFRQDLKDEFFYSYFTSDQQRILPLYFQKINDIKHLCENILIYKLMYPLQKNYSPQDLSFCQKFSLPIKFDNPQQFNTDYQAWLQKALFE